MHWDFSETSLLGLGFGQHFGSEMGFEQNVGWEMGFIPPRHLLGLLFIALPKSGSFPCTDFLSSDVIKIEKVCSHLGFSLTSKV